MAWWSADVLKDPSDEDSDFETVGELVAIDFDAEDGDYRNHYRAILEKAFETEPRIRQGHVSSIRIG